MKINYYNNIGMGVIALGSVLEHRPTLSISKAVLVYPFVSHQALLKYLGRKNVEVKSLEKLITDKMSFFSNFNHRYYDSLCLTFNAIQMMHDFGFVSIQDGYLSLEFFCTYDRRMGKRAELVYKASRNISLILTDSTNKLYSNLRVEI